MRKILGLLIIFLIVGFWSIEPKPNAVQPGALSTKTTIHFNKTTENFWFLLHHGFKENKLISRISYSDYITNQKSNQRKFLDSLGTGRFNVIQPPSCVHLTNNLFIDEAEITNIDYQEFLFYIKRDSTEDIVRSAIPQTKIYDFSEADYFSSPQYRFFPVVGLTHDQAKMYCKWRSNFVTNLFNTKYKKQISFNFRLPTENEWELAASNGLDKMIHNFGIENESGISYKVNSKAVEFLMDKINTTKTEEEIFNDIESAGFIRDLPFNVKRDLPYFLNFKTPYYTYSFYKNDFGIYNMIGNVAEMINKKGIAKGGSFKDELSVSSITDRTFYENPMDNIGFRCVCEVQQY